MGGVLEGLLGHRPDRCPRKSDPGVGESRRSEEANRPIEDRGRHVEVVAIAFNETSADSVRGRFEKPPDRHGSRRWIDKNSVQESRIARTLKDPRTLNSPLAAISGTLKRH
jgi:hypothetical protein